MAREGTDFELDSSGATGISVVFNKERQIVGQIEPKTGRVVQSFATRYVVDKLRRGAAVLVYRVNAGVRRDLRIGVQVVVRLGEIEAIARLVGHDVADVSGGLIRVGVRRRIDLRERAAGRRRHGVDGEAGVDDEQFVPRGVDREAAWMVEGRIAAVEPVGDIGRTQHRRAGNITASIWLRLPAIRLCHEPIHKSPVGEASSPW